MTNVKWDRCPAGQIKGMVRQIKGRHRKILALKFSGSAVTGLLLAVLALGVPKIDLFGQYREYNFGGITCTEVRARAKVYMAGKTSLVLSERIKVHLEQCPNCPTVIEAMMKEDGNQFGSSSRHVGLLNHKRSPKSSVSAAFAPEAFHRHSHQSALSAPELLLLSAR